MIRVYTQLHRGQRWLKHYRGQRPVFACVLGFTATGLIPGISAAGATPADRQYTAIADAEFLCHGPQPQPQYPLPPLDAGASPVLISRAVLANQDIPYQIFNAGLPHPPPVPYTDLDGQPARCLTGGDALDLATVKHLLTQGITWGEKLAAQARSGYVMLGECVVGGTTTALAILTGLGFAASGKVSSSHPQCNHAQKWAVVQTGLAYLSRQSAFHDSRDPAEAPMSLDPLPLVAAVGDPMQIAVAGMAIRLPQADAFKPLRLADTPHQVQRPDRFNRVQPA